MPVNFDDYREIHEEGGDLPLDPASNAFRILRFLAADSDLGFTPSEIREHVDVAEGSLNPTLARLETRGLVEHESPYWSAAEDDRLAALDGTFASMAAFEARHGDDDFARWHESDDDRHGMDADDGSETDADDRRETDADDRRESDNRREPDDGPRGRDRRRWGRR